MAGADSGEPALRGECTRIQAHSLNAGVGCGYVQHYAHDDCEHSRANALRVDTEDELTVEQASDYLEKKQAGGRAGSQAGWGRAGRWASGKTSGPTNVRQAGERADERAGEQAAEHRWRARARS